MSSDRTPTTVLGLGAMGHALAAARVDAGHPTTVWNRTPARAAPLEARGAAVAPTVTAAVTASPLVVVCLLDHASVHDVLDPVATAMRGRTVVNVTTTTPAQAREIAGWAAEHDVAYVDGGIMAVPEMIGRDGAAIFYSGAAERFDQHLGVLELWGEPVWFGTDAGMASLQDLALLAGMYAMFGGFFHGAAMVAAEGVSAQSFAARAAPFLAAMTGAFAGFAEIIDAQDYAAPGQQSLAFSDLEDLLQATRDQGVATDVLAPVQALIRAQIDRGHGAEGFARIVEELRSGPR